MRLIRTQFENLDESLCGGFLFPSLVVIGGRPAMGKTAFMLNLAKHFSENGEKVLWISLEEKEDRLQERFKQIDGESDKIEWYDYLFKFEEIIQLIYEANKHTNKVKIFFIDYLQLLYKYEDKSYESSSYITHTLKKLANELGVIIICSSQLNRNVEARTGHRPMLKDLRDSGSIEEDADQILLLLRRDYYDPNDRPGEAELILAKNRRGETRNIRLNFVKETAEFCNYLPTPYSFQQDQIDKIIWDQAPK